MDTVLWVDSAFLTKAEKGEQCSTPFFTRTALHVRFNVSLLMFPLVLRTFKAQILNILTFYSVNSGL